jgi:hypothetical protein
MNKNRINRLEKSVGMLQEESIAPAIWRTERGKIAIQKSYFILERLESLDREVWPTPHMYLQPF